MKDLTISVILALVSFGAFCQGFTLAPTINGPCAPGGIISVGQVYSVATYPAICPDQVGAVSFCGLKLKCKQASIRFHFNYVHSLPWFGAVEVSHWQLKPHSAGQAVEFYNYLNNQGELKQVSLSFFVVE